MTARRKTIILSFIGSHLLLCVLSLQAAFAVAFVVGALAWAPDVAESPAVAGMLGTMAGALVLIAIWTAVRGMRT